MIARDTTPEAAAMQLAIVRKMSPGRRSARELTLAGIRARHPSYTERDARFALLRLLYGDDLFRRAWPRAPLLAP